MPSSVDIPGFDLPQVMATSPDGSLLYVAQNDGSVQLVKTPGYARAGSWQSGIGVPLGIAISPDGRTVFLSNRTAATVSRIEAATGTTLGSWSTGSGTAPTGIGLSPDGATIYVPHNASAGTGANALTVRDAATGAIKQTWTYAGGSRPRAVVVSPDGARAYVSLEGANRISVVDTATGRETAGWPMDDTGYLTPGYLALSKRGDLLYVAAASPSGVVVLGTTDGGVVQEWDGIDSVFGLAATNCSQTVFVSNWTNPGDVVAVDQPNQCQPQPPSAPRSVSATWNPKTKAIAVSWTAPADQGSGPITAYTATAKDKDPKTRTSYTCTVGGTVTNCQLTGVKGGPTFSVTVTAANEAGTGPASAPPVDVKTAK